ncbi:TPA: biopolymer transporter ExbD [Candidatus Galligastranaerophilus intestinigallinarum]|nr:biopolymer transporter ExbD [Candidatus Galligastranaerophilus intestinigallinarum]
MKRPTFNEINITPLTDIFLVLLIIMMVIAPMLDQQGLKLAIPEYVEQTQDNQNEESKILTIVVDENNKYYIDDVEIPVNNLANEIKTRSKTLTDGLMIEVQGNSAHGSVVKLMDVARNSGVQAISITEI